MAKIYLTGAVSDWDDPFAWHDELVDEWPNHEFVNPYTLNDFELGDEEIYERPHEVVEPALEAVEDCDGMLVRWDDDAFLVGSSMEMKHAFEHDLPIVVWYDGYRDNLSPWILHTTRGNFEDLDKSMKVMLSFVEGTDSFNFTT
jgi:hypothetical protein